MRHQSSDLEDVEAVNLQERPEGGGASKPSSGFFGKNFDLALAFCMVGEKEWNR